MIFSVLKFYALLRSRITPNFGSGFLVFNIETAGIVEHLRKHMWPFLLVALPPHTSNKVMLVVGLSIGKRQSTKATMRDISQYRHHQMILKR